MNHQAPLRVATIAMVDMSQGKPFGDTDLLNLLILDNGEFQLSRVRSFLTILVRCKALVCMGRGWTGSRFRPGRRWQQWKLFEPKSALGGNSSTYVASRQNLEQIHDRWRLVEGKIRQRIHDERMRKGLSEREFAAKMGVNYGHVQRIERGRGGDTKRSVTLPVLVRVAIALDMTLDELVGWAEVKEAVSAPA